MLGTILKQQGDAPRRVEDFDTRSRYDPTSAEAHLSLGQALSSRAEGGGRR